MARRKKSRNFGESEFDPRDKSSVSATGVVIRPGKFEGEMWWVAELWDRVMDGVSDEELYDGDMPIAVFKIDAADRKKYGIMEGVAEVWLTESENGFVNSQQLSKKQADKFRDQLEAANEADDGDGY